MSVIQAVRYLRVHHRLEVVVGPRVEVVVGRPAVAVVAEVAVLNQQHTKAEQYSAVVTPLFRWIKSGVFIYNFTCLVYQVITILWVEVW